MTPQKPIRRDRTALNRTTLSKPTRMATEAGLIVPETSVFDYGCGLGGDLKKLVELGITADGWDPNHRPEGSRKPADVVNLGYVVNVIEDPKERTEVLKTAWGLTKKVLVVSARLKLDARLSGAKSYEDGFLTQRDTFQKLYDQSELREWLDTTLDASSVPVAPGIFFVFKSEEGRQSYLASRYRRRRATPKVRKSDMLYDQHRDVLEPLLAFLTDRGRLPDGTEAVVYREIIDIFGSLKQAFALIRRVTGPKQWEEIRQQREEELLLHFALDRFSGRPRKCDLPEDIQIDVKAFFGTYTRICKQADALLFEAGNMDSVNKAMEQSPVGKLTGAALYIHADAMHLLPLLLRVYEGCARIYLGQIDDANIIKLNRIEPKVSYLEYPKFDSDPHPALFFSMRAALGWCDIKWRDFSQSDNPPILHRKETFIAKDDPRYEKFARLTRQEEGWNLYENTTKIGTRRGWEAVLEKRGVKLKGHRVVKR